MDRLECSLEACLVYRNCHNHSLQEAGAYLHHSRGEELGQRQFVPVVIAALAEEEVGDSNKVHEAWLR